MINLFEYQNKATIPDDFEGLEVFLEDIWLNREKSPFYLENDEDALVNQPFIRFLHKTNQIGSNKYVGVIHYNTHRINLLPKIFFDGDNRYDDSGINQIHNHILWWLSYCRKIKFPNYETGLGDRRGDFFEVLIYLFSKYTKRVLSDSIFQQYEEVAREIPYMKGRLNVNEYINNCSSKGRWHKLDCSFDQFTLDNEFNRIIKYVAGILLQASSNQENKKYLREILFILDEVSDAKATPEQCDRIVFNPMFTEFEMVRDYCKLFLKNSISFNYKSGLRLFAFLLPMEYVFEDFLFGFIDKEIPSIVAKSQRRDIYLDESKMFNLRPDLYIKTKTKSVIADTKYKIVYSDENDVKKGISQADLYQMLAYAVRFEVDEVILFYPDTIKTNQLKSAEILIKDSLANNREIVIKAFQLPIINRQLFAGELNDKILLKDLFGSKTEELKVKIGEVMSVG